jgi:Recombination endonuclease VII
MKVSQVEVLPPGMVGCRECGATMAKQKSRVCAPCQSLQYKAKYESDLDLAGAAITYRERTYSMGAGGFRKLLDLQGGRCACCGDELDIDLRPRPGRLSRVHVDHDHSCCAGARSCGKCVRGILCVNCNAMLGRAKDDPERLRSGAEYLERTSSIVR